ncbi:Got1/Sft2-like family-domain-containing protein [Podospora fimiseda]|uniref:Protein transport protein SFT2 n=1 Tax=Podospora fimiseda TaxID=252190 RepID=A0AAN7BP65_9PEZI|nr:Got1/Sft2-like family-domain-containing protein [Podospora fimiseda]
MASSTFRDSINSLGWSRRDNDLPVNTSRQGSQGGLFSQLQSFNPFGDRGYVQLPTHEAPGAPLPAPSRREEEEGWFALSRWDRMLVFAACNIAALLCFVLAIALFPALSLARPRKLVVLWTLGSILFLSSFAAMMGPWAYVQHLASAPRLPFTAAYFGSLGMTIYFSIGLQSTILTLLSAIIQLGCLVWYLVSYFPMGSSSLRLMSSFGVRRATTWMTS